MDLGLNTFVLSAIVIALIALVIYVAYHWLQQQNANLFAPQTIQSNSTKIILGDKNDSWGEITRYQGVDITQYEALNLNQETLSNLSVWFQQAPGLAMNSTLLSTNVYVLKHSPEVAAGLKSGLYEIMKASDGGIYSGVRSAKKIVAQSSFHPAQALKSAAAITAVWQVLAVITAQKLLSNINRQLADLHKQIHRLQELWEHQQYGKLINNLKYLDTIRDTLEQGQLEITEVTAFLNQLELIERECGELMEVTQMQLERQAQDFKQQNLSSSFGLQKNFVIARALINNYEQQARKYQIAVAVRGLATQTRCALPVGRDVSLKRLRILRQELERYQEKQQLYYQTVTERASELTGLLSFDAEQTYQKPLAEFAQTSREKLKDTDNQLVQMVDETINKVHQQMMEAEAPLSIVVELDDQAKVTKAWRLVDTKKPDNGEIRQ